MRTRLPFLSRRRGLTTLLGMPGLEACFDAQIPSSVNPDSVGRVAQWNDLTGRGRNLIQGTAASQPIYLPWSGQNYGYCPGATGNYFTSPDSAAASVTGDIDIRADMALVTWTPAGFEYQISFAKRGAGSYQLCVLPAGDGPAGTLRLNWWESGGTLKTANSSAVVSFSANQRAWIRATLDVDNGSAGNTTTFYTSSDGITWNQLGTTIVQAGVTHIRDMADPISVGGEPNFQATNGRIFRSQVYNGIGGTLVVDFDPSRATDGASSFVAATGETWTVNTSGGKPAQIVGRASVMFDGVDDWMSAAIPLTQPTSLYFVLNPISWVTVTAICDGLATDVMHVLQQTSSPNVDVYAGAPLFASQLPVPIGTTSVVPVVFNGANSVISRNRAVARSGATGTLASTGLTLAARALGTARFGNFKFSAVAAFTTAHDARTRARVIDHLINRHRIAA